MSERELIRVLSRIFRARAGKAVGGAARAPAVVGIGDDAAVLRAVRGGLVWTIDASVEGVHFERRFLSLRDIGARSFHAAVSDLAAMGARPLGALSCLVVPVALGGRAVREIARGQAEAARELGCAVVGGNLSRGGELSVTTTAIGVAKRPLLRSGARPGDEIWLAGDVGLAAAGLRFLVEPRKAPKGKRLTPSSRRAVEVCVAAWRRPRALVQVGLRLALRARAAIDVSDGLAGDARQLADASGVRLVLEERALRGALRPELREAAMLLGIDALDLALEGGEDYALVATGHASRRPRVARRIGRVAKGHGVVLEDADDGRARAVTSGFDHFAARARQR